MPTDVSTRRVRAEIRQPIPALRTISAQRHLLVDRPRADDRRLEQARVHRRSSPASTIPSTLDHYINASTQRAHARQPVRQRSTRFNYDVLRSTLLQQRITGFYNAQCCGLAFEYQTYNFSGLTIGVAVPSDHRFFLSFTLAGLGNFSPFNGALSGAATLSRQRTMPASDSRHRRRRIRRQPLARSARPATAPTSSPGIGPADRRRSARRGRRGRRSTARSRRGSTGRSPRSGPPPSITAPARPRRPAWDATEPTFAANVRGTHHLLDALRDAGVDARVLIPSSALVYPPADEPLTEDIRSCRRVPTA